MEKGLPRDRRFEALAKAVTDPGPNSFVTFQGKGWPF